MLSVSTNAACVVDIPASSLKYGTIANPIVAAPRIASTVVIPTSQNAAVRIASPALQLNSSASALAGFPSAPASTADGFAPSGSIPMSSGCRRIMTINGSAIAKLNAPMY